MRRLSLFGFCMAFATAAVAQETMPAMPVVPAVGVSPVLQWLMGIVSVIISVCLPLFVAFAKQRWNVQSDQARAGMISDAVGRAAHLADAEITANHMSPSEVVIGTPTMDKAMSYVADAYPHAIAATPEATDEHIAKMISAEINKIKLEKTASVAPSVVVSPVSAIR
jgi:hypothetical protein